MDGEIVLVTGGSGFLGQHVVRELVDREPRLAEVRVLDLERWRNRLGHDSSKVRSIVGDITNVVSCQEAFKGVSCVFHCAAYVSYDYPADVDKLYRTNVVGTQNVIKLCQTHNVPRLVFTSTIDVTLTPCFQGGFFCAVINQTEAKGAIPQDRSQLLFSEYASTKLDAELLVCEADGSLLESGGVLRTTALRPTVLYGEEDQGFLPRLMKIADYFEGTFPRFSGRGGKHQVCYAGNAGYAHVCANNVLRDTPEAIGGMPIYVTDESPIIDSTKFCVHMTEPPGESSPYHHSWWHVPSVISYYLAILLQPLLLFILPYLGGGALPIKPTAIITYLGSIILYNRLRADIHLRYEPVYSYSAVQKRVIKYYTEEARIRACSRKLD